MAHQAGAYPSFHSMNRLGVFLLPPGWGASPSQGYPPVVILPVPIYTPGWREVLWELSVLPKNTTQCPQSGLKSKALAPEWSALTMRSLCLLFFDKNELGIWVSEHMNHTKNVRVSFSRMIQTWLSKLLLHYGDKLQHSLQKNIFFEKFLIIYAKWINLLVQVTIC